MSSGFTRSAVSSVRCKAASVVSPIWLNERAAGVERVIRPRWRDRVEPAGLDILETIDTVRIRDELTVLRPTQSHHCAFHWRAVGSTMRPVTTPFPAVGAFVEFSVHGENVETPVFSTQ